MGDLFLYGRIRNPCVHHRIDHHSEIKNNVNRKRKKGHTSREKECDFFYGKREKDKPGGYRKDEPGREKKKAGSVMEKSSKRLMPEISKERVAMWRQMNPVGRDRIDSFLASCLSED